VSGATNVTVAHNTTYDTGTADATSLSVSEPVDTQTGKPSLNSGVKVANNIIEKFSIEPDVTPPSTCDTNLIAVFSPKSANSGCVNTIASSPQFDGGGYYLQSGSPAKNAANASYPPDSATDLDLTSRTGSPDIGAREWHPVTDTFTDADGPLSEHEGEGAVTWTPHSGDNDGGNPPKARLAVIADNAVVPELSGAPFTITSSWTPPSNTYGAETIIVFRGPSSAAYAGPVCRFTSTGSKTGYVARLVNNTVELGKLVNGTYGMLDSKPLPTTYVGDWLRLGVKCGSTKEAYVIARSGQAVASSSDNTIGQVGRAGVRANSNSLPVTTFAAFGF
jgi:hypothetical protein